MKWILGIFLLSQLAQAAEFPSAEISNGIVKARLYLPDAERGYYRGVRFDWSGVVSSLTYKGHEFFGQWFEKYDPLLHDSITGPVEEFRGEDGALGYAETKVNGMFMKIGVGVLRRRDADPYNFARSYTIVNPGRRIVRAKSDRVEFVHELSDGEGYGYQYTKVLRLPRGKPQLVLEHELKNTGKRAIDSGVYDHDFYMLDAQPTGPNTQVKFAFPPKPKDEWNAAVKISGSEINYTRELAGPQDSAYGDLIGFGETAADNDVRVENIKAKIGVHQTGDKPVSRFYFWSVRSTVCPEIYIRIHIEPGQTFRWQTKYEFYLLE